MKTKSIRNIFVLALILFTVFGCSRYEEGPCISFRSVLDRIEGEYEVVYLSKNDIDITQNWKDSCDWHFYFDDNENTPQKEQMLDFGGKFYVDDSLVQIIGEDMYAFDKNKKELFLGLFGYYVFGIYAYQSDPIGMNPFITGSARNFDITRLTPTELWLKKEYSNGDVYIVKLGKIAEL